MNTNNDIIMPDITEDDVIADLQQLFLKLRRERLNRKFKPKKPEVSKLDTAKYIKKITKFSYVDNHI